MSKQVKTYLIKLVDKNNNTIWTYRIHGYDRQSSLNIFAHIVIADVDIQFDVNEANKVFIEEE